MIKKRSYYEKNGICTFHEFASELSYEELLTVNGGCGGGTTSSRSQSQGPSGFNSSQVGGYISGGTISYTSGKTTVSSSYSSGRTIITSGSSCGGGTTIKKTGTQSSSIQNFITTGGCGGGIVSSYNSDMITTTSGESCKQNQDYQKAYNEKDYHCDIYAWNLAIDNGVDPTKDSKDVIDLNQYTVSDMCKKYFAEEDLSKGICKKGTKGFAFYDGTDDGVFNPTHVEFYDSTNSSSDSFIKYTTDGITEPSATQRSYSDARNANWTFVAL